MLRGISLVILWGVSALCIDKEAADAQKIYLIGSLTTSEQFVPSLDGFKARMAELGYREGQNVRYSFYNSKGDEQLLKAQTEKLVQEKPDLIVTTSTTATLMAAKTTERLGIPVLFLSAGNPSLLVRSFKSSGTNLAGISSGSLDLVGKRFELLRQWHWQKLTMNCSRPRGQSQNSSPQCPTNSGRLSTSSSETRI